MVTDEVKVWLFEPQQLYDGITLQRRGSAMHNLEDNLLRILRSHLKIIILLHFSGSNIFLALTTGYNHGGKWSKASNLEI